MKHILLSIFCIISLSYAYNDPRNTMILIPKNEQNYNEDNKNPFANHEAILIIQDPFEKNSRSNYKKQIMKDYMEENGIRQNRDYRQEKYNKDGYYAPEIEIGIRIK